MEVEADRPAGDGDLDDHDADRGKHSTSYAPESDVPRSVRLEFEPVHQVFR
jgi:hypothetical protein